MLNRKNVAITLLLLLTGLTGYRSGKSVLLLFQNWFAPKSVSVVCTSIYSDDLQQEIRQFLVSHLVYKSHSDIDLNLIYKMLKYKFKFVKKMCWEWKSFDEAVITVEGVKPLFFINNKFVLGNKKRLFDASLFSGFNLDSLKTLKLGSSLCSERVSGEIYQFLCGIPESYWKEYDINYRGMHDVVFEPRNMKLVRYVVDENVVFDGEKIKKAALLSHEVKNKFMVCDLRFKDCICVRHEKV